MDELPLIGLRVWRSDTLVFLSPGNCDEMGLSDQVSICDGLRG